MQAYWVGTFTPPAIQPAFCVPAALDDLLDIGAAVPSAQAVPLYSSVHDHVAGVLDPTAAAALVVPKPVRESLALINGDLLLHV